MRPAFLWSRLPLVLTLCAAVAAGVVSCNRTDESPAKAAEAPAEPDPAPPAVAEPVAAPAPAPVPEVPPAPPARPPEMVFRLPTANDALFRDDGKAFYMFVDRYTPEGTVQTWEAGGYGLVRNPRETSNGTVYTRFHEGMDIAPMERDAKGEPLDVVHAIADGVVAYCTANARASNYGNYVVIAHGIGRRGKFYSLCAHLREIQVKAGDPVKCGDPIGLLGYTGAGIDRRRAHVHVELCLLLSEKFDTYYAKNNKLPNPHGNFHGSNLLGFNVPAFFKANHEDPALMPDDFLRTEEVYFRVLVPNKGGELDLVTRYPFLRRPGEASVSWEIFFTGTGVPVAVAPSTKMTGAPAISGVKPFDGYHSWNTRGLLGGSGQTPSLSSAGKALVELVSGDF